MMITNHAFSFKSLLASLPRGEPLSTRYFAQKGLTPTHAAYLADHEWLVRLGRGAYMLPGDQLTRDGCLGFLFSNVERLHVGAKTALAWRGVQHNLEFRETIELWGDQSIRLPTWLTDRFPCRYQITQIFDDSLPKEFGVNSLPSGDPRVLVSGPERALLELLSDTGKTISLEEVRNLVESARNLRLPIFEELLTHLKRIKVARLAALLSAELDLPWAAAAKQSSERLGGGARWVATTKIGKRLSLRR
jgi:hypothetical protein